MSLKIIPLSPSFYKDIIAFADENIGKNYFSMDDLEKIQKLSTFEYKVCSLIALDGQKIIAIRLSFASADWETEVSLPLTKTKWPVKEKIAYFKSLFVAPEYQAKGLGQQLSSEVLKIFKEVGFKGVVTHSWLESPNNSSVKYLERLGFEFIKDHPKAWSHIDYECVRCAPVRCYCTAREMFFKLETL